jgi:peptide/nickel transport system permease protein
MLRFVVLRTLGALGVLLVLVLAVFVLQQISPADPARSLVGEKASAEILERARERLGLNDPIPVQYLNYVSDVARGDLQMSVATRRPVADDLGEFLPATLELVAVALLLAIVLGVLSGLATAGRWRGAGVTRLVLLCLASLPVFLSALLGIRLFYSVLGWLPATGRSSVQMDTPTGFFLIDSLFTGDPSVLLDSVQHLVLPAIALSLGPAVAIGRALRSSLTHTMRQDWIRTARSKGLSERRVLLRHGMRNSLNPVLSLGGLQVAYLFGGVLVIEQIFAWPGVGLYTVQAIARADFPAIAGVTLALGVLYVLANTLVDILQAWADPRIRA